MTFYLRFMSTLFLCSAVMGAWNRSKSYLMHRNIYRNKVRQEAIAIRKSNWTGNIVPWCLPKCTLFTAEKMPGALRDHESIETPSHCSGLPSSQDCMWEGEYSNVKVFVRGHCCWMHQNTFEGLIRQKMSIYQINRNFMLMCKVTLKVLPRQMSSAPYFL